MSWGFKLALIFLPAFAAVVLMPWPAPPDPTPDVMFAALYRANHREPREFTLEVAGNYYECDLTTTTDY